jgi:hypothetical protein
MDMIIIVLRAHTLQSGLKLTPTDLAMVLHFKVSLCLSLPLSSSPPPFFFSLALVPHRQPGSVHGT